MGYSIDIILIGLSSIAFNNHYSYISTANVDYEPLDRRVIFDPFTDFAVVCERVNFIDDAIAEIDETLAVTLSDSRCAIATSMAIVTILSKSIYIQ